MGTLTYDVSQHWRLGAGWRHFVVHQDSSDIDAKLALSGPFLSFAYRF